MSGRHRQRHAGLQMVPALKITVPVGTPVLAARGESPTWPPHHRFIYTIYNVFLADSVENSEPATFSTRVHRGDRVGADPKRRCSGSPDR